ncbi:MAG: imidazole glycerol phosphate synthase subunit HisH [Verrucomicrobia bacterium]|nr:imidazole glycerol phosphate synthase subunit HisH [Verrucomicrobiota bacterium]
MIAIINYGSGNVGAIANIYKQLKVPHFIASKAEELKTAGKYILPGVGHFDTTMEYMRRSGLQDALEENVLARGRPLLGICVGMQILANSSEEGRGAGLGWIPGRVLRIEQRAAGVRLPHMGWNSVVVRNDPLGVFRGVETERGFYFLHSYYFQADAVTAIGAEVNYGSVFACAVSNGKNIVGVQFHPEKSHHNGMTVFRNFAAL